MGLMLEECCQKCVGACRSPYLSEWRLTAESSELLEQTSDLLERIPNALELIGTHWNTLKRILTY